MKNSESAKAKEILTNFYQNSKMLVWIYSKNLQLNYTNFNNATLLHLMDAVNEIAKKYQAEASYLDSMKLYGSEHEAYLCFQFAIDRLRPYTVIVGPALLSYPSEEVWKTLSFHKQVWANRREETLNMLPVITLESFLLNSRFIMQVLGIYHLNPLQIADSLPMTNYYYKESRRFDYLTGELKTDFYSVTQAHEVESEIAFHIRKGNAEAVDGILIHKDRIKLLLPAEKHKENFIYAIALLSIGRNAAIEGGMRAESAYSMFKSYSIQLQAAHQSMEFYRLIHNALCAYAEGVQTVSVQKLDCYSDTIKRCINLIYAHLPGKITLEELSSEVHLSSKYLSALFVKETGDSVTEFVTAARIDQATHMLSSTNLSYLEISNILEFSSQSHFTKVFKQRTGFTPKEYRLKMQNTIVQDSDALLS